MLVSSQQSVASAEQILSRHTCTRGLVGKGRAGHEHSVDFHARAIWQVCAMLPGLRARHKAAKVLASCINLQSALSTVCGTFWECTSRKSSEARQAFVTCSDDHTVRLWHFLVNRTQPAALIRAHDSQSCSDFAGTLPRLPCSKVSKWSSMMTCASIAPSFSKAAPLLLCRVRMHGMKSRPLQVERKLAQDSKRVQGPRHSLPAAPDLWGEGL